jgi:hypothetical protein
MRSPLQVSGLSSLLSLLVLSGCNTAYREAMSRAEDAAIRGDFMTAAHAYRAACASSPDDEKACSRAPVFAQKATDQAIANARPACEAGDLDNCLPPLVAAWELIPNHPELTAMFERAAQLHTERCAQWKAEGSLAQATAGLACLQSRGKQLPIQSYQSLLSGRANQLAQRFSELAASVPGQTSAGAANVLWGAAQCLAPEANVRQQVDSARQGFLSQSAIPVAIRVDGKIPNPIAGHLSSLCQNVSANLAPAAQCYASNAPPGQQEPLEIRLNAFISNPREDVLVDMRTLRYLREKRQIRNPAYVEARERLKKADYNLQAVESAKQSKDEACEQSKRTHSASAVGSTEGQARSPCDEASEFAKTLEDRTRERNEARTHLNNTPETLIEEVWDDFVYPVRTHRWASNYRFTLQSSSPGSAPTPQQDGALRFEDQEHVGFAPGGLQPNPLDVPPARAYADAFTQQVAPAVFSEVQRDSIARGNARRAQCNTLPENWDPSWVQCWAEATLWESGREPQAPEFLRILAASTGAADQPQCR